MLTTDSPDWLPPLLGLAAVVLIVSRLLRWFRVNAEAGGDMPPRATPPRRPLWGPGRKLEKLNQNTALVRAQTDLLTSTSDQVQARHNLDRLRAELTPPPPGRQPQPAGAFLTLPEIRAVLASIDMPRELRDSILELIEAAANEKPQP